MKKRARKRSREEIEREFKMGQKLDQSMKRVNALNISFLQTGVLYFGKHFIHFFIRNLTFSLLSSIFSLAFDSSLHSLPLCLYIVRCGVWKINLPSTAFVFSDLVRLKAYKVQPKNLKAFRPSPDELDWTLRDFVQRFLCNIWCISAFHLSSFTCLR